MLWHSADSGADQYVPCPLQRVLVSCRRGAGQAEYRRSSPRLIAHELKISVIFVPSLRVTKSEKSQRGVSSDLSEDVYIGYRFQPVPGPDLRWFCLARQIHQPVPKR